MPKTIRFHLDENVDLRVATGLRQYGIDVTTSPDVGLLSATDDQQLAYNLSEGRVMVSHDQDFPVVHAAGRPHPGIAFARAGRRSIGDLVRGARRVWELLDPDDMANRIEYL